MAGALRSIASSAAAGAVRRFGAAAEKLSRDWKEPVLCDGALGLLFCSIAKAGPLTLTGWKHLCLRTSLGARSFFILELGNTSAVCSKTKLEGLLQTSNPVRRTCRVYLYIDGA